MTDPSGPRPPTNRAGSIIRRTLVVLGRVLLGLLLFLAALWTFGALWYAGAPVPWLRQAAALLFVAALLVALIRSRRRWRWVKGLVVGVFVVTCLRFLSLEPRQDRDWIPNESRTAWAEIDGDRVRVHNVRYTRYRSDEDYDPRWETRAYDLLDLRTVDFIMVPFQDFSPGAHTLVSFGFADGRYLAVSIEARKEVGEEYGILPGLFRQFEVIYVVADERDLIGVRTHIRHDTAYIYPGRTTPEGRRAFLLDLLAKANNLHERPEFYDTVSNTCTSGLRDHLNRVRPDPLPWSLDLLFPGYADRYAHEHGLLDTDLPLAAAKERFRIDVSRIPLEAADFSAALRAPPWGER